MEQVKFLVQVECKGHLMTANHYFAENLRKLREDRVTKQLTHLSSRRIQDSKTIYIPSDDAFKLLAGSNVDSAVQEAHDTLQSYYKVAKKRFIDVVCMQAVDHILITSPNSPLKVFTPKYVGQLSLTILSELAGEDSVVVEYRRELEEKVRVLQEGVKLLS